MRGNFHVGPLAFFFVLSVAFVARSAEWQIALPGWRYAFPRDHGAHPSFKTEWWYFTGNLRDERGAEFGYQVTWFRQGISRAENACGERSRWIVRDFDFAHFTVSDLRARKFFFSQKVSRGAFGEAGSGAAGKIAWIGDWQLFLRDDGAWELRAKEGNRALHLTLTPAKPPAIHGENGVSAKASGAGHASCYYSQTRLAAAGEIVLGNESHRVTGDSWFDHEWATNQLTPEQAGWNWFSLQFSDNTELMLYQMRTRDGGVDPASSGTFIAADGAATHLAREAFQLTPLAWWKSAKTGARYPVKWKLRIPSLGLEVEIATPLENQELALEPIAYWEGAVRAAGTRAGGRVEARGYMELTGYSGALRGLAQP